ncbi:MAG: hypothetical protein GWO07_08435 [Candidatus Dadabacteria bacterium]|nr:hypothetical protein [Candidatus Dadabacteria bacterium]NIS08773.1 hypothetical protein [Candidatus Dadabacteria bacterium]NIV42716.1 hypothetical protein [Candidatus Dadabacteria bacterium]NIX15459.1 hypothetical protein [Candidatus Dadabacteria bacterium]NIY22121.1 hypothetical protein [Candidatus Dadabacteria bacterium]
MFKGNIDPMKEIWSHSDDVTYLPPSGGVKVGWQEVLAEWQSQADMKMRGTFKAENMKIVVGNDIAVSVNYK